MPDGCSFLYFALDSCGPRRRRRRLIRRPRDSCNARIILPLAPPRDGRKICSKVAVRQKRRRGQGHTLLAVWAECLCCGAGPEVGAAVFTKRPPVCPHSLNTRCVPATFPMWSVPTISGPAPVAHPWRIRGAPVWGSDSRPRTRRVAGSRARFGPQCAGPWQGPL